MLYLKCCTLPRQHKLTEIETLQKCEGNFFLSMPLTTAVKVHVWYRPSGVF